MLSEQPLRASLQVAPLFINKTTSSSASSHNHNGNGNDNARPAYTCHDPHRQQGCRDGAASARNQTHITPPATPNSSFQEDVSITVTGIVDDKPNVFHPFLRAFHPFHPNLAKMDDSVMMPLGTGDVIMVHSIHTNGWADGTMLMNGARGWLPTNYCEPYDPEQMRNLLHALLNFWDLLRSASVNDRDLFGNQEFVKGIIAGVRHLLQRTNCLTKESQVVQSNEWLKKGRKSLLSELSALIKTAKRLQELQNSTKVHIDDVTLAVDEMILRGFKLVVKAARFLDIAEEDKRTRVPPSVDVMATVLEEGYIPPTPPADAADNETRTSSSAKRASGLLSGRPLSFRLSYNQTCSSHRASFSGTASMAQEHHLVSDRLCQSHDAFLSQLSSFIGRLHLQSQSRREAAHAIKQAATLGEELLAVIDAVCSRSVHSADILGYSRTEVWARIRDLVIVAKDILWAHQEADLILASDNTALRAAATACVKAAGDCVAKTKWVMERIGDFEFEGRGEGLGINLGVLGLPEHDRDVAPSVIDSTDAESTASSTLAASIALYANKPLPRVPRGASPPRSDGRVSPSTPPQPYTGTSSASTSSIRLMLPPLPKILTSLMPVTEYKESPATDSYHSAYSDSMACVTTHQSLDSEASLVSQTSTRATTPDIVHRTTSSFSSTSTIEEVDEIESQLMQKTFAHELMHNREGQVTAGSLPALIERLTTHESTPDAVFVSTFYLTFRLFCTAAVLAQSLVDRFEYVVDAPKVAGPVRLRVYNVFKGWLESHWRDETDRLALPIIKDFAETKLAVVLPSAGRRLLELAFRVSSDGSLVPRLVSSMGKISTSIAHFVPADTPIPPTAMSKSQLNLLNNWRAGTHTPTILEFEPLELARQLTLKQMRIFCSIMPEEMLASQWMKNSGANAPNVKAMSALSTDLSNLVSETILHYTELKKRAAVIKHWIKVAQSCHQLHNYDGLIAIICSLNSSIIDRLRRTWEAVSQKRRDSLKQLQEIVEPSQNHKLLRARLQTHVPPCLPFLGMYLTDLTFVDIGNPATKQLQTMASDSTTSTGCDEISASGTTVINFDKHTRTAKIIGELQRFQIPYRLTEIPEMQEWMATQINHVRESPDHANVQVRYYRKSLLLEPRETPLSVSTLHLGSVSNIGGVNGNVGPKTPIDGGQGWPWMKDRSASVPSQV